MWCIHMAMLLDVRSWPIQIAPTQYHHLELSLLKPYYKNPSPLKMFYLGNRVCLKNKKKIPYVPFWFNNKFHTKTLTSLSTCDCVAWKLLCYHILKEWFWFRNIQFGYILSLSTKQFLWLYTFKKPLSNCPPPWVLKGKLEKSSLILPMYSKQWYMKNLFHLFFKKFYKTKKDLCSSKRVTFI